MKKFFLIFVLAIIAISCTEPEPEPEFIAVSSVKLNQTSVDLYKGESVNLTVTILPENATNQTISWYSADTNIAVVVKGKVTAIAVGSTTITAKVGNISTSCRVTVKPTEAASIKLDQTSVSIHVDESVTLTATILPENTTDKTIKWSSVDQSIATVDQNGKITGIAVGSTTITAQTGNIKATCSVTVKPTEAASIKLDQTSVSIHVDESVTLTATILPENTTDKTIKWSSVDQSIATVDQNGKITGIAVGSTTITAQTGNIKATCSVTVKPTEVSSIKLDQTSVAIVIGESVNLTATILPENATNKTISWSSSDQSVATVTNGRVTAIALGNAVVTAQVGNIKANCAVTVKPIEVTSIILSQTSITLLAGESLNLTATIAPDNATDKSIVWSSSDSSIATVSKDGKVTAIAVGSTSITAKSGTVSAVCSVTVRPIEVTSIVLNQSDAILSKGESISLTATITPENATNKTIIWASADSNIATVSKNGVVTGCEVGTTQISANIDNAWAYCTISVLPSSISFNQANITMNIGNYTDLTNYIVPNTIPQSALTWISSNPKVVSVSNNGVLSALQKGESIITAQLSNGVSASCHIIVINNPNAGGSEGTGEVEW